MEHTAAIRQCCAFPVLAACLFFSPLRATGQGIIYYHFPVTVPQVFPYDANGLRLITDPSTPINYALDLNHDGITDYTFIAGPSFSVSASSLNGVIAFSPGAGLGPYVIPLQAGALISPDSGPNQWTLGESLFTSCRDIGCIGYYTGVESAYTGLQFQANGQTFYGWIRLGAPLAGFNGGWLYEYAFQTTPNTPIFAGEVPEPSTLALIGSGGTIWLLRKRRHPK